MTRDQKRNKLVTAAGALAFDLQHGGKAYFGNQGVSVFGSLGGTASPGDIIGYLLKQADILPDTALDINDPKEAVALALNVQVGDLPMELQKAINELAITSDDTKRSYKRRVPKLVRLLGNFVTSLYEARFGSTAPVPVQQRKPAFVVPGNSI